MLDSLGDPETAALLENLRALRLHVENEESSCLEAA
jgi:hypothetical protein